eukprot:scaffold27085_cov118-Isochrysis_galbana.AAC.2
MDGVQTVEQVTHAPLGHHAGGAQVPRKAHGAHLTRCLQHKPNPATAADRHRHAGHGRADIPYHRPQETADHSQVLGHAPLVDGRGEHRPFPIDDRAHHGSVEQLAPVVPHDELLDRRRLAGEVKDCECSAVGRRGQHNAVKRVPVQVVAPPP